MLRQDGKHLGEKTQTLPVPTGSKGSDEMMHDSCVTSSLRLELVSCLLFYLTPSL